MHPAAVLVLDVAAFQPPVERQPVSRAAGRRLPVKVLGRPGKQARWPGGPALQDPVLLLADQGMQILVDGDERLAFHLVVEVPQIRGSVSVAGDAVPFEAEGVGDPQPAVDQDQGHQPVGGVAPSV